MLRRLGASSLAVALWACTASPAKPPEESNGFKLGMARLCEVDQRAGLDPDADPVTIEGERYDWALNNVEDPDVIELVTLMRVQGDAERIEMLRVAAHRARLQSCPLADTIAASL